MDEVHDLKTSSKYVGIGVDMLLVKIKRGEIAAIRPGGPGGRYYIPQTELERLRRPVVPTNTNPETATEQN